MRRTWVILVLNVSLFYSVHCYLENQDKVEDGLDSNTEVKANILRRVEQIDPETPTKRENVPKPETKESEAAKETQMSKGNI